MTPEEFHNYQWQKPNPKPDTELQEKEDTRKFWFLWVPLGAIFGVFIALVTNGGGRVFFSAWGIVTLLSWAIDSSREETE